MRRLSDTDRARIIRTLCEGNGVRPTARICGVAINTVQGLIRNLGPACEAFHDLRVRGLSCQKVQADEAWAFNYCRQKNVKHAKTAPENAGDVWVWSTICADSKIVVSWYVGDRDANAACNLLRNLGDRVTGPFELNTDGLTAYHTGIMTVRFPVAWAKVIKHYATPSGVWNSAENRYQGPRLSGVTRVGVMGDLGAPDTDSACTSFSERLNLSIRMQGAKWRRLSNTHSKRLEMLRASQSLYFTFYNFCRPHKSLGGQTPAMVQGLTDRPMPLEDLARLDPRNP